MSDFDKIERHLEAYDIEALQSESARVVPKGRPDVTLQGLCPVYRAARPILVSACELAIMPPRWRRVMDLLRVTLDAACGVTP